jgi:hypothetical protein
MVKESAWHFCGIINGLKCLLFEIESEIEGGFVGGGGEQEENSLSWIYLDCFNPVCEGLWKLIKIKYIFCEALIVTFPIHSLTSQHGRGTMNHNLCVKASHLLFTLLHDHHGFMATAVECK